MLKQWISWTRNRNGADPSRTVGRFMTRTGLAHIDGGNHKTLCGRAIGPLPHEDNERRKCPICQERANKIIQDARRTSKAGR